MSFAGRLRAALPLGARLHRMPLLVKLIAAVLALVFVALSTMSVGSTYALHSYLLTRADEQLIDFANRANAVSNQSRLEIIPPTSWYVAITSVSGVSGPIRYDDRTYTLNDLPPLVTGAQQIDAVAGAPRAMWSINRQYRWRALTMVLDNGSVLHAALPLSDIDRAVTRLIWVDLLIGGGALLALAALGAAVIRQSLVPLVQIERTAAAIAAGDLTQRVPDPEQGSVEARTELGRLARALNTMLTQIEAAFTARARSETAARSAELAARDAAAAAQQSEARAVRSEEKMRQFVADASHELRTPLTTIRGFAELYRQGAVSTPQDTAKLVRRIEDEAARMGLLVEDLLLLARLDRERPLTLAPVELPVLALDAVRAAQARAPERSIELDIQDAADNLVAFGDDARLRQVIGNLMTNALVHTPPEAAIILRLYSEAGNLTVIEVADTGPGLRPEHVERVFERFYRADEARTRHTERADSGTGLGLAIVAAIVRAHHGTVEAANAPGGGAVFRVRLPFAPPSGGGP